LKVTIDHSWGKGALSEDDQVEVEHTLLKSRDEVDHFIARLRIIAAAVFPREGPGKPAKGLSPQSAGGIARAAAMAPEDRAKAASKAAKARWGPTGEYKP
jgi:hypothetical protein